MQSQLHKIPFLNSFIARKDSETKKIGLQQAMRNFTKRSGTKLVVIGKTVEVEKALQTQPVILVANHPYESDTLALFASLPTRKDTYMITNAAFTQMSSSIDEYLIPVYISHHGTKGKEKHLPMKFFNKFHPMPAYSPEEEHKKNIKSIQEASEKITKGGMVIIFPKPRGTAKEKSWYSGVGHLIKGVAHSNFVVINAYIEGTSDLDYFRLIPGVGKILPTITITFSKPRKVNDLQKHNPKEITALLEEEYTIWVKSHEY